LRRRSPLRRKIATPPHRERRVLEDYKGVLLRSLIKLLQTTIGPYGDKRENY